MVTPSRPAFGTADRLDYAERETDQEPAMVLVTHSPVSNGLRDVP